MTTTAIPDRAVGQILIGVDRGAWEVIRVYQISGQVGGVPRTWPQMRLRRLSDGEEIIVPPYGRCGPQRRPIWTLAGVKRTARERELAMLLP